MGARLRLWWKKAKKPLKIFGIMVVCVLAIALIVVTALAYIFKVNVPGLRGKTLWDWLQLLIIPAVLAGGGSWFNHVQKEREQRAADRRAQSEQEIAEDNQRETALQAYIDKMSELLLEKDLRKSEPGYEVREITRVRTLTLLPRLDGKRQKSVLQFLHESHLIDGDKTIVYLVGADLSHADLQRANLSNANLREVNLSKADLSGANLGGSHLFFVILNGANMVEANLCEADLTEANLSKADLSGANLYKANLFGANLCGAIVTNEQLNEAISLEQAVLPDGKIHP